MTRLFSLAIGAGLVLGSAAAAPAAGPFMLTSTSFTDGSVLAQKYAGKMEGNPNCPGDNISPQLAWSNVPEGTASLVFFMIDPEGRGGAGVNHWVAYGVNPARGHFAEGEVTAAPSGFTGGKSTQGLDHYMGPCTPPGTSWHHYTFVAIATDLAPDALPPGLTREEVVAKLPGHTKGSAGMVARFKHL